jgi:hypothetical protein
VNRLFRNHGADHVDAKAYLPVDAENVALLGTKLTPRISRTLAQVLYLFRIDSDQRLAREYR